MRIQIKGGGRDVNISLPTGMLINKFVLRLAFKSEKGVSRLDNISPAAADAILAELRRIRKNHGSWELLEVDSADGERIKIVL